MTTSLNAFTGTDDNKVYFFSDDQYIRYDKAAISVDEGYPRPIGGSWKFPFGQIDAVTDWDKGKAYFFSGKQCVKYDLKTDTVERGPVEIQSIWYGLPFDSVDAAVKWDDGTAYFFKGDQYVNYDIRKDHARPGFPKKFGAGNWPGMPFDSVDTVFKWDRNTAIFVKGAEFVRYNVKKDRVEGGVQPFTAVMWPGLIWRRAEYNWMGDTPGIEGRKLSELTLPATHDSAGYLFNREIAPVNDLPAWVVKLKKVSDDITKVLGDFNVIPSKAVSDLLVGLNASFSATQRYTIGEQIAYGVRSLDLRVCASRGDLYTYHGLLGAPVRYVLGQLKEFLETSRQEVLVVTASHMSNLSEDDHARFIGMIFEELGPHLFPYYPARPLGELTFGEVVNYNGGPASRVIFCYDLGGADTKPWLPADLWPSTGIYSVYTNTSDFAKMKSDQQEKLDRHAGTPSQMFELAWTLTPQSDDVMYEALYRIEALISGDLPPQVVNRILNKLLKRFGVPYLRPPYWHSLEELTRAASAGLRPFVAANAGKRINSLSVDFFEEAGAVRLAIDLSRQARGELAASGVS